MKTDRRQKPAGDFRCFVRILAAVVSLSTQEMTASRAQMVSVSGVSCDEFMKRLASAATVLEFQMPTPTFQRVPTAGSDYWWVSYSQRGIEAEMSCRDGAFQEFEFYDYSVRAPVSVVSDAQTYHLIAASVYAYTGWRPREVLEGASQLMETARDEGNPGTVHLPNGAAAHLWKNTKTTGTVHLTIELGGHESR
jgi:hypothetical protein